MQNGLDALGKVLILLACAGYPLLAYSLVAEDAQRLLPLALGALPLLALGIWLVARSPHKARWLAVPVVAGGALYGLGQQEWLALAVAGIPHAAAYGFLLWLFVHSLMGGREPLVTRLARRVHGTLPPEIEGYTRHVTIAWCLFFAAQLAASAVLLRFGSRAEWSFAINVCNLPLVAGMFVGEYAYRVLRYRDFPHVSFLTASRAFAKDSSIGKHAAAR